MLCGLVLITGAATGFAIACSTSWQRRANDMLPVGEGSLRVVLTEAETGPGCPAAQCCPAAVKESTTMA